MDFVPCGKHLLDTMLGPHQTLSYDWWIVGNQTYTNSCAPYSTYGHASKHHANMKVIEHKLANKTRGNNKISKL